MKMRELEVDQALYDYIAAQTQRIGESASEILRRILGMPSQQPLEKALRREQLGEIELTRLLSSANYHGQRSSIGRFMLLLSAMYQLDPEGFIQAAQKIRGRKRLYFAKDMSALIQRGSHTKPKAIPKTPYWVITNINLARKRLIIGEMMQELHLPEQLAVAAIPSL